MLTSALPGAESEVWAAPPVATSHLFSPGGTTPDFSTMRRGALLPASGPPLRPLPDADQAPAPSSLTARTCTRYWVNSSSPVISALVAVPRWSWPPRFRGSIQNDSHGSELPAT